MPKPKGFTLIELLITITIIAILSAIGLVIYSSVLRQGRDSKRQSDLRSIQSALEQYHLDMGYYPYSNGVAGLDDRLNLPEANFTSDTGNPSPPATQKTYLNSLPHDPTNPTGTNRYKYVAVGPTSPCDNSSSNRCNSYCLYARLENSNPGLPSACPQITGSSYNFVLTPP